jgi:predicted unusual protein kinase regulating ubiquinone biosynthesis (AarF/ABC1/UbiB family)
MSTEYPKYLIRYEDPHPGNIFLTDDRRLAVIDFGMVVSVPPSIQQGLVKLVLALNDAEGDAVAAVAVAIGRPEEGFDYAEFRERIRNLVVEHSNAPIHKLQTGRIVMDLHSIAGETNLRMPAEVMMLGKTLMKLDRLVEVLDPDFLPRDEMRYYSTEVVQRRSQTMLTLDKLLKAALETGELTQALPARLNKFTVLLAENQLKFQVHGFRAFCIHL